MESQRVTAAKLLIIIQYALFFMADMVESEQDLELDITKKPSTDVIYGLVNVVFLTSVHTMSDVQSFSFRAVGCGT